jgi:hypothetical protein
MTQPKFVLREVTPVIFILSKSFPEAAIVCGVTKLAPFGEEMA